MYRTGKFFRLDSDDELDTREIEQYGLEDVEYTPDAQQAVEAVDADLAQVAFLVRAPTVEQVFAFANRGETMPQKSTFFYPKLTSGLFSVPAYEPLARAVPRRGRRREGRARGDADARGARAADRPRPGRRHDRCDRRGGRDRGSRALRPRRHQDRLRGDRDPRRRPGHGRRRSDRRLAERRARRSPTSRSRSRSPRARRWTTSSSASSTTSARTRNGRRCAAAARS